MYQVVSGYVTLYQYGTPDAFFKTKLEGDSLSIWSGNDLIWIYAVGLTTYRNVSAINSTNRINRTCPDVGGIQPNVAVKGQYSCASGNFADSFAAIFYNVTLFGAAHPINNSVHGFTLPQATNASLQLRLCLNQNHGDEDIYVQAINLTWFESTVSASIDNSSRSSAIMIFIVVGAIVGCVVLLIISALFFLRRRAAKLQVYIDINLYIYI